MTQFSKSNLLTLISSQLPSFFSFKKMTHSSNRNRSPFFITFKVRSTKMYLLDPWKMDDNGTRSTFISKLHLWRTGGAARQGWAKARRAATTIDEKLYRSCWSNIFYAGFCSQQDRWTLSANKLKCIACEPLIHFTNN